MRADETLMERALKEARKGRPSPNPHVGAVIARGSRIVSVGHHRRAGADHAEVMAIRTAGTRAKGATLYVTFEPCNHFGRTPPCTDAIISAGLKRVVIGCRDPVPHKKGSIAKLKRAGIVVKTEVLEGSAKGLVRDFVKHRSKALPFVTLKSAMTLDGRIATRTGESQWITGPKARLLSHHLRATHDAVLVGSGTVLHDNPSLTVRDVKGPSPTRVVLDTRLRCPPTAAVFRPNSDGRVIVIHSPKAPRTRQKLFDKMDHVERITVRETKCGLSTNAAARELAKRDIVRLMVEGGARVSGSFIDAELVDDVVLFSAPMILADPKSVPFAIGKARPTLKQAVHIGTPQVEILDRDVVVRGSLEYARR